MKNIKKPSEPKRQQKKDSETKNNKELKDKEIN